MHALDILGEPVRRRILEVLVEGEKPSGAVVEVMQREFGISQPAVSQHLKVLREAGLATVRADGQRRLYAIDSKPLQQAHEWLGQFKRFWEHKLDALETEIARGKRERRLAKPSEDNRTSARRSTRRPPREMR